ncbi:MAG: MotA/TolQ/ExbB proton channel family protein [Gammaproteobacteria bacterium]|nr:MotA/TolQ/ExbB proton channel family protein [Gammaproteobacteria bacterium]
MIRFIQFAVLAASMAVLPAGAMAQGKAQDLNQLLKFVKQGTAREAKENKAREAEFARDKGQQQARLAQARQQRAAQEARSEQMENVFDENELQVAQLSETLTKRLGSLKELFGVLQQVSQDARGQFESSLTNVQYPERGAFLDELSEKMGATSKLASIEDIEQLWFELSREMAESGKVVKFTTTVIDKNGEKSDQEIMRVGVFNLVGPGKYYDFDVATQRIVELQRQPKERFVEGATALYNSTDGFHAFGLDPTRGQLLKVLIQVPTLREKWEEGGIVGKIITALGVFAAIIAVLKLLYLVFVKMAVASQKRNPGVPKKSNALGRVLAVYHDNKSLDTDSLELKIDEAVLKEIPKIQFGNTLIKVIAVVAPLLGLVGTVTVMILTFQAITLYGTGDPKLMAGGISQALVTTVLGLCVAIPTVLLHTFVAGFSKSVVQVLDEQAAGLIAQQSEQKHA